MSEAFRCDITGSCIADGENRNPYWKILERNDVTILGVPNVKVSIEVKVDVFQDGTNCHLSQDARNAINTMIKNYVAANL